MTVRNAKTTLGKAKEIEDDTCQSEDNMKTPLFKVKESKKMVVKVKVTLMKIKVCKSDS